MKKENILCENPQLIYNKSVYQFCRVLTKQYILYIENDPIVIPHRLLYGETLLKHFITDEFESHFKTDYHTYSAHHDFDTQNCVISDGISSIDCFLYVPCTHCKVCVTLKGYDITNKLQAERENRDFPAFFCTFTVADYSHQHRTLSRKFIGDVFKKLNNDNLVKNLAYIANGEYGANFTLRPHYHTVVLMDYPVLRSIYANEEEFENACKKFLRERLESHYAYKQLSYTQYCYLKYTKHIPDNNFVIRERNDVNLGMIPEYFLLYGHIDIKTVESSDMCQYLCKYVSVNTSNSRFKSIPDYLAENENITLHDLMCQTFHDCKIKLNKGVIPEHYFETFFCYDTKSSRVCLRPFVRCSNNFGLCMLNHLTFKYISDYTQKIVNSNGKLVPVPRSFIDRLCPSRSRVIPRKLHDYMQMYICMKVLPDYSDFMKFFEFEDNSYDYYVNTYSEIFDININTLMTESAARYRLDQILKHHGRIQKEQNCERVDSICTYLESYFTNISAEEIQKIQGLIQLGDEFRRYLKDTRLPVVYTSKVSSMVESFNKSLYNKNNKQNEFNI